MLNFLFILIPRIYSGTSIINQIDSLKHSFGKHKFFLIYNFNNGLNGNK